MPHPRSTSYRGRPERVVRGYTEIESDYHRPCRSRRGIRVNVQSTPTFERTTITVTTLRKELCRCSISRSLAIDRAHASLMTLECDKGDTMKR